LYHDKWNYHFEGGGMPLRRFIILIILLAAVFCCSKISQVNCESRIGALVDSNIVIAYEVRCPDTTDNWVGLTWKEKGKSFRPEKGKIFAATNSDYIRIRKISIDTLRNYPEDTIKVYIDTDSPDVKLEYDRGVRFIYELKSRSFFEDDSLRIPNREKAKSQKNGI